MSADEAFLGIKPDWTGLLIWRVEEFKLVKWTDIGAFYTGDSYLIYHAYTVGTSKSVHMDIYYWQGSESTTDETGTVAIKAIELDDFLGGKPTQYREIQYHETAPFQKIFDSYGGIRYLDGGVESGFRKVEADKSVTMYQIKGRRNPVLVQVPPVGTSLNHGDVFIVHQKGRFWLWFGKS